MRAPKFALSAHNNALSAMLQAVQWGCYDAGMPNMNSQSEDRAQDGLRERKRRDTLQRIAQTGLDLFIAKGYEATTLDDVAAAAGISRRTFFHYFTSKDEILLAWQVGLVDALYDAVLQAATDQSPLEALCGALQKLASHFDAEKAIDIARVLRSKRAAARSQPCQIHEPGERRVRGAVPALAAARPSRTPSNGGDGGPRRVSRRNR